MANPSEDIARDHAPNFRHARTIQRRAATVSLIESVIEWYDFFIFGTAVVERNKHVNFATLNSSIRGATVH
ncbi:MHS family MFS transporter [Paraburkholderia panacisoli]|uniref:MHS family MFS transporter n=1 Tax=Paraburkholderia panacisoli TaxID=2603818 RepID=A0A5B0GL46_9BURK|nr:MHS family MFS transporter [Paraburkholderia panacisoli]KAA1003411.1 MHS family MFS transporter [Paraburkholderia panacisoli]